MIGHNRKALPVPLQHLEPGQQMVRQRHGLRPLKVRVAWDEHLAVRLRRRENCPSRRSRIFVCRSVHACLKNSRMSVGHLVVPAPGRVQFRRRRHPLRQRLLDVHVDIFELRVPDEFPGLDLPIKNIEPRPGSRPLPPQKSARRVPASPRAPCCPLNVKRGQPAVERHGFAEPQHQRGGLRGKTSAPGGLSFLGHRLNQSSAGRRPGQFERWIAR